jgi:hypothetical protein
VPCARDDHFFLHEQRQESCVRAFQGRVSRWVESAVFSEEIVAAFFMSNAPYSSPVMAFKVSHMSSKGIEATLACPRGKPPEAARYARDPLKAE